MKRMTEADVFLLFNHPESRGIMFDFGFAMGLNKKVPIIPVMEAEGKLFVAKNAIEALKIMGGYPDANKSDKKKGNTRRRKVGS